jgi:ABC-type transport system involved in multi-copper enzyme maturation permease subunit
VSPFVETRLVAERELRRSIRSVKGIVLGVLTLIGSVLSILICTWLESQQREKLGAASTDAFVEMKRAAIEKSTGDASLAAHLSTVPTSLLLFLKITIWFGPLLIGLLGFDTIAGELQHRSVRFWTVRARRSSFFAGKFFGLWALVSTITLTLNAIAGIVVVARGYVGGGALLTWGLRFWLTSLPITAAWAAIALFISSLFKTPILGLLTTFGTFFVLWLFGLGGFISRVGTMLETGEARPMSWYEYVYPNAYDEMLLSTDPRSVITALAVLFGVSALIVAGGSFLFAKRDI